MHTSDCCSRAFAIEVRYCERVELWYATVHEAPRQFTLWPDELDAVESAASGVHTAVKDALRRWMKREASFRSAAARGRLRELDSQQAFDGNDDATGRG